MFLAFSRISASNSLKNVVDTFWNCIFVIFYDIGDTTFSICVKLFINPK